MNNKIRIKYLNHVQSLYSCLTTQSQSMKLKFFQFKHEEKKNGANDSVY